MRDRRNCLMGIFLSLLRELSTYCRIPSILLERFFAIVPQPSIITGSINSLELFPSLPFSLAGSSSSSIPQGWHILMAVARASLTTGKKGRHVLELSSSKAMIDFTSRELKKLSSLQPDSEG